MMKRSRFTQEQISGVLKEHQAGGTAPELCRELKSGEDENARLKKPLAYSMLDVSTLREILAKNV
jgi:putative transposase